MARRLLLSMPTEEELLMDSIQSIMPGAANSQATGPTAEKKAEDQKTQFLQLLVAQLKGQNPLNPLDGTQFVTQLAQFSSLEQLATINATLTEMKGQNSNRLAPDPTAAQRS
jgi:flagellar basal-body rod modification protein FlgD